MRKIILSLILLSCCMFLISCKKEKEESIIYGDIDINAKTIEIKKPKSIDSSSNIIGNTYINLYQDGLITENEDYYFYVINYENETYLIKEHKLNKEKTKIYKGNLRNLFIVNNWIYSIENLINNEKMVVMDVDGNNIYTSPEFKKEIRTMMSDGNKIYFTLDASNLIGMTISTAIYSCDMDFNNITQEKLASSMYSQIDLLNINNNKIYFNETYKAESDEKYIYVDSAKNNYPIIDNDNIKTINFNFLYSILDDNFNINTFNIDDEYIYLSITQNNENFIIKYNIKSSDFEKIKTDTKIISIYILEDLIGYDGEFYIKINK